LEKNLNVLNQLRTAEALAIVYKLFDVDQDFSPESAIEEWESELLLVDLQVLEKRLDNIKRASKGKKIFLMIRKRNFYFPAKIVLNQGSPFDCLN
jgi:ribosome-binding ATPase YchF (GTP1/OBG family)